MAIRVVLVDDHQILREGLKSLLSKQLDMEVVGEASSGREALELARKLRPDVMVMDIAMRDLNGIDATRQITSEIDGTRVVALSTHSDRRYVSEMLAAGATGYLLKDGAFDTLAKAIRSVASGQVYLAPGIADVVVADYVKHLSGEATTTPSSARGLTAREREVLQLIAEGISTKEIASKLHLSVKTVETHRRQIMEKLGIYNVAGLVKYAVREGLASIDD
jgi:DNA-binding NarL/FixJ family response regulator